MNKENKNYLGWMMWHCYTPAAAKSINLALTLSANLRSALDLMGAVILIFPRWFSMMRRSLQGRCLMCSR